jgi:hypothetical protein
MDADEQLQVSFIGRRPSYWFGFGESNPLAAGVPVLSSSNRPATVGSLWSCDVEFNDSLLARHSLTNCTNLLMYHLQRRRLLELASFITS